MKNILDSKEISMECIGKEIFKILDLMKQIKDCSNEFQKKLSFNSLLEENIIRVSYSLELIFTRVILKPSEKLQNYFLRHLLENAEAEKITEIAKLNLIEEYIKEDIFSDSLSEKLIKMLHKKEGIQHSSFKFHLFFKFRFLN